MIREVVAGFSQRIRLENSLQLQRAMHLRPEQVRLEVAKGLVHIDEQLTADPKLAKRFNAVKITVPEQA
jgi:hypothetical protein